MAVTPIDLNIILTIVGIVIGALVAVALYFMHRAAQNEAALIEQIRCSCENHISAVDGKVVALSEKFTAMDGKVDTMSEAMVKLETRFDEFTKAFGPGSHK